MIVHEGENEFTLVLNADSNGRAFRAVAHGIFEQIAEDAIEAGCFAHDAPVGGKLYGRIDAQFDAVIAKGGFEGFDGLPGAGGEIGSVGVFFVDGLLGGEIGGEGFEDAANHHFLALGFAFAGFDVFFQRG